MKKITTTLALAACLMGTTTPQAKADSDPFIGTIMQVGQSFCPRGWAETNGALLAISSHSALFSLLGTMYGGDGRTTFALPDLRGRHSMGVGTGPGLTTRRQGQRVGVTEVAHSVYNMPSHTHAITGTVTATVAASSNPPDSTSPLGNYKPTFPAGTTVYAESGDLNVVMGQNSVRFTQAASVSQTGSGLPVQNQQPFIAMKTCIALVGVYPSRN